MRKYNWDGRVLTKKPIPIRIGQFRRYGKSNKLVKVIGIDWTEPSFIELHGRGIVNKRAINPYKVVK